MALYGGIKSVDSEKNILGPDFDVFFSGCFILFICQHMGKKLFCEKKLNFLHLWIAEVGNTDFESQCGNFSIFLCILREIICRNYSSSKNCHFVNVKGS